MKKIVYLFLIVLVFSFCQNSYAELKMMEKKTELSKIEVLPAGEIQFNIITKIFDGGKVVATTEMPYVLSPGDSLEGQDEKVQAIANAIWTKKVIDDYKEMIKQIIKSKTEGGTL